MINESGIWSYFSWMLPELSIPPLPGIPFPKDSGEAPLGSSGTKSPIQTNKNSNKLLRFKQMISNGILMISLPYLNYTL